MLNNQPKYVSINGNISVGCKTVELKNANYEKILLERDNGASEGYVIQPNSLRSGGKALDGYIFTI